MKKFNYNLAFFIILFTSQLLFSKPETSGNEFFKISKIPIEIENATLYLTEEIQNLSSTNIIPATQKSLESVNRRFTRLLLASDSVNAENTNLVQIQNFQRRWIALKNKIDETLTTISYRIQKLETKYEHLQKMQTKWNLTLKQETDIPIPQNLIATIGTLTNKINAAIQIVESGTNELLTIQLDFSNKNVELIAKLNSFEDIIIAKQKAIFDKNSDTLWEQISDTNEANSIFSQASQLLVSYSSYLESFYKYSKRNFANGILIFILLLLLTFGLKYFGGKIEDSDPLVHKAILLFNMPISISFLLFLIILSLNSENAIAFQGIRRVLMLIPLLFILLKIIDTRLKETLYIFIFLFFVNELRVSSGNDNLLEHLILLGLTVLTFFAVYWAKKDNLAATFFENKQTLNLIKTAFSVNLTLISFVFILNLLGFVALANVLFNGFHNSVFATILFLTANLVFNAIILILLKTKTMQKLNIVLHHSQKIISTSRNIIKVVLSIAWVGIILNSFNIYNFVYENLAKILSTNLGYGSTSISISGIILFSFTIWISFQISKFIQFVLEIDILPQMELARGVPGTITSITKYIILSFGFLFALVSVGIDFNKFALLFGALGVGIGFGLQNLVNNFISGIILIFEHPIQIGDIIKVGEITGTVKKIGIRASIVRNFDGSEIIVPNGNLISAELTNWTLSDKHHRIDINVGVKYGSDVEKVKILLLKCASENSGVLKKPNPTVLFQNFGNSSLDFLLRCWSGDIDNWLTTESELRFAINKIFNENNIEIPFPQTDIYIKEIPLKLNAEKELRN